MSLGLTTVNLHRSIAEFITFDSLQPQEFRFNHRFIHLVIYHQGLLNEMSYSTF